MATKPTPQLTKKQQAMVKAYVSDPKMTKAQAYLTAYNVKPGTTKDSIASQASQTFNKPTVKTELAKYNGMIEDTLVSTVQDWGKSDKVAERSLATDTAKYIHDKIHGKATQRTEVQTTGVTLTIDLTSSLATEDE